MTLPSGVATHHPDYDDRSDEWALMRDTARGTTAVKAAKATYLPMPSGFVSQEDKGALYYAAYQARARVPEVVEPAVAAMVGVIHQTEIKIDLPDSMAFVWEAATKDGLPLEALHRRITGELLTTGRYALLAGASSDGVGDPYLTGYAAEALINWDESRSFFVLDESGLVRDGFAWNPKKKYRVLELTDGKYTVEVHDEDNVEAEPVRPTVRGGAALDKIPFVVIGPRDLSVAPETPPLIGVARAVIAMYQLSADYRWQLFMSGQETLFVINADAPERVGAGVVVSIKGSENITPDAKYVGPEGVGIAAHRIAMQDEAQNARDAGARLFNSGQKSAESGEALRIRYTAELASIFSITIASCAGLEAALRNIALMIGADPAEVIVTPPKSLIDKKMTPEEVNAIMSLFDKALLAWETVYENLQAGGIASPERTAEEERKLIDDDELGGETEPNSIPLPTPEPEPAA